MWYVHLSIIPKMLGKTANVNSLFTSTPFSLDSFFPRLLFPSTPFSLDSPLTLQGIMDSALPHAIANIVGGFLESTRGILTSTLQDHAQRHLRFGPGFFWST